MYRKLLSARHVRVFINNNYYYYSPVSLNPEIRIARNGYDKKHKICRRRPLVYLIENLIDRLDRTVFLYIL